MHPEGWPDSRGYELGRILLGPGIGVVVLEVLDIFWLRLKFARVTVAVPYKGVLALVVDPLPVGAVQAVGIRAALVCTVIRLEVVYNV